MIESSEKPGTRKPTGLRLKLAMLGLAVFSFFLIAEVALRIFWHNPYRHDDPDHLILLRISTPGRHFILNRALLQETPVRIHFRVNERGYIYPVHQFDDPDTTIAFFGGSTTECFNVDEPLRFPALVSTLLAKRGLKVNTLNAGRSATTIHDALNILVNHVIEDRPDVVVFMEATSDMGVLSRDGTYHSRMSVEPGFSPILAWTLQKASSVSQFVGALRAMATIQLAPARIVPVSDQPVELPRQNLPVGEFETRLRAFVRVAKAFGITPVLMTQPLSGVRNNLTPDWARAGEQEAFNDATRRVGREEDALVIDLVRHFVEDVPNWKEPMAYFLDGVHVTDRGSKEEAAYISQRLAETILAPKLASKQRDGEGKVGRKATATPSGEHEPTLVKPRVP